MKAYVIDVHAGQAIIHFSKTSGFSTATGSIRGQYIAVCLFDFSLTPCITTTANSSDRASRSESGAARSRYDALILPTFTEDGMSDVELEHRFEPQFGPKARRVEVMGQIAFGQAAAGFDLQIASCARAASSTKGRSSW